MVDARRAASEHHGCSIAEDALLVAGARSGVIAGVKWKTGRHVL